MNNSTVKSLNEYFKINYTGFTACLHSDETMLILLNKIPYLSISLSECYYGDDIEFEITTHNKFIRCLFINDLIYELGRIIKNETKRNIRKT